LYFSTKIVLLAIFSFQKTDAELDDLAVPHHGHRNLVADLAILQDVCQQPFVGNFLAVEFKNDVIFP